jgi:sulfur carrier protein ThiS
MVESSLTSLVVVPVPVDLAAMIAVSLLLAMAAPVLKLEFAGTSKDLVAVAVEAHTVGGITAPVRTTRRALPVLVALVVVAPDRHSTTIGHGLAQVMVNQTPVAVAVELAVTETPTPLVAMVVPES